MSDFISKLEDSIADDIIGWRRTLLHCARSNNALERAVNELKLFRYSCFSERDVECNLDCCLVVKNIYDALALLSNLDHEGEDINFYEKPMPPQLEPKRDGFAFSWYQDWTKIGWSSCHLFGAFVYIEFGETEVLIRANTAEPYCRDWEVREHHVDAAIKIESKLLELGVEYKSPPIPIRNYVCPEYYPKLYS